MPLFGSGSIDQQQFEPKWWIDPFTTYNSVTWPSQDPYSLLGTSCELSEGITADLGMSKDYPYPRVLAEAETLLSPVSSIDDNCERSTASYAVKCNGPKAVAKPSSLAVYCDRCDVSSDPPSDPIRGTSPDNGPESSHLSCLDRGFTKQLNQPHYQCSLCPQHFTRRDNVKPHVRKKHPNEFGLLYAGSTSMSKQSSHASTMHHSSAHDEFSAVPGTRCDEDTTTTNILSLELKNQAPSVSQPSDTCSRRSTAPQKRSYDGVSPTELGVLDGSELRSAPRLKTCGSGQGRSLACPFQKRDPLKHQKCFGVMLQRIKDVKQHIYRCHSSPEYYCAACYKTFDTANDRDDHSRRRECEKLDHPSWLQFEGITEEQRKQLGERSSRNLAEEEQWYQIWDLIFPNEGRPRSAYLGDFLRDIVPILRRKWKFQGPKIMEHVGGPDVQQLSCAMDEFFRYLEGETVGTKHDVGDRCAAPVVI